MFGWPEDRAEAGYARRYGGLHVAAAALMSRFRSNCSVMPVDPIRWGGHPA